MPDIITSIEVVTPELAAVYLNTMQRNRSVSPTTISRYRNAMSEGDWEFTAEPIHFDSDGHLINGQHRLLALCQSETTQTFLVIRGLGSGAQMAMDQGRFRQAGQQLGMLGIPDALSVASGVRLYLSYSTGYLFKDAKLAGEKVTTLAIERWVESHRETVADLGSYITNLKKNDAAPMVAYAAALVFYEKSPEATREFFNLLANGAGAAGHPITALDKRLSRQRREGVSPTPRNNLGLFFQAWNAWRRGRVVTTYLTPRGGWSEENYPRVI